MSNPIFPLLIVAAVVAAAAIYFFVIRKKKSADSAPPPVLASHPMDPANWVIGPVVGGQNMSAGMPLHPTANISGGWFFDFPAAPGHVNAVTRAVTEPGRSVLKLVFSIEGDAQFVSTQDGGPGHITLFIQRRGDDYTASKPSYRFFGGSTKLAAGEIAIELPLTSDNWSNVFGQRDAVGLQALLADMAVIGMVFGNPAAGATAHGMHVTGSARLVCKEFRLT